MEPKKKNFNYYSALKISVVYLIFSSLYILLSDKIIIEFLGDSVTVNILNNIQSYKGLAFVFVTSALIFVFVQREINSKEKYIKTIELQNKKLEESEYKYSNLFYSMEQGVTYQNDKGEIIDANPAAIRILGLTLNQMQGKSSIDPDWKAIHEDGSEYPGDGHPSMVALKTGKIVDNIIMGVFNPKQKDYKWIKIDAIPQFRKGESTPFQVFTTFYDITAEHVTKQSLNELYTKYQNIIHTANIAIAEMDTEGSYTFVNPAWEEMFGYRSTEALDKNIGLILQSEETDHSMFNKLKNGKITDYQQERKYRAKNGRIIWCDLYVAANNDLEGNLKSIVGLMIDKTEAKKAELLLKESEQKFRNIFDNTVVGKSLTSVDGTLTVNKAFSNIVGYTSEELASINWKDITHPDDIKTSEEKVNTLISGKEESVRWEKRYIHKKGNIVWVDINTSIQRDDKGEPKYFITAIYDITLRKYAEKDLLISELNYKNQASFLDTIIENSPFAMWISDENGYLMRVNQVLRDTLEIPVDMDITKYNILEDENFSNQGLTYILDDVFKNHKSSRFEMFWLGAETGEDNLSIPKKLWVFGSMFPITDHNGKLTNVIFQYVDITERKQAEQELKESEEKFYKIFQNSPNSIILTRVSDYEIVNANEATTLITGYSLNELIGKKQSQINIWKSADQRRKFNDLLIKNGIVKDFEAEFVTKSGENCIWKTSGEIIQISNKKYILGIIEDINDIRKQEQEILRQSEFINAITEYQPAGIVACDEEGKLVLFNKAAKEWHGIDVMKISQQEWAKHYGLYSADGISILETNEIPLIKAFNGEKVENFEIVIKAAGQKPRMVSCNGASFFDQTGTSLGAVIVMNDITLQKEIENNLIKSEETAHKALNNVKRSEFLLNESGRLAKVGGWQWDVQEEKLFWTDETYQIHDLEKDQNDVKSEELIQKSLECYTPEDRDIIAKAFDKCTKTGEEYEFTVPFKTAKGRNLWIRTSGQAVLENNKVITVTGLIQDITESKRIQEKIERSEFLLNEAGRMAKIGAWEFDLATQKTQWSDQVFDLHAIPVAEVPDFDFIMGCYIEGSEEILRKSIEECITERKIYEQELRFLNARNEKLWVRAIGYPIINDKDEIISIRGVVQDITELKESILHLEANEKSLEKAVIELERSEFLLNETGKLSKVGGWDMDLTTMTPYFSEETYRIYDIPIGVPPKIEDGINFYAPEARPIIQKAVAEAIEKNEGYDLQVPFITAKGKRIWVRTIAQVQVKDGKAVRMFGAIQDITQQKETLKIIEESQARYKTLFESQPTIIWEEDFSDLKKQFDNLKKKGVEDFNIYFEEHPEAVKDLAAMVKVVEVNSSGIEILEAESKEDIVKNIPFYFDSDEAWLKFKEELVALAHGEVSFQCEIPIRTVKGNSKILFLKLVVHPDYTNDLKKVLVTFQDISEIKIAEEELKSSEKRFRAMIEGAPDPIFIQTNKCFAYLNNHAVNLFGAKDEKELIGKPVLDFFHPDFHKVALERIKKLNDDKTLVQKPFEQILIKMNGKEVWVETKGEPLVFNDENGGLVFVRDISYRKKAEKELQDSKNKLKELLDSLESGVVVHAPDTSITYYNQRAAKILRARYDELTGKPVFDYPWDFLLEDGTKLTLDDYPVSQIIKRKQSIKNMVIGMSHDDNTIWALLNGFPILDEKGEIKEIIISFIEITEQIKANTIIKESEAKYKLLADNITDVISLQGHDAKYEFVSPSIKKVRGYDPEELLGKNPYDFIHPDDINETINEAHTKLLEKGLPTEMVYRFKHKDGHYGWFESNRQPILDENNNILKIVSSSRDISDRIKKLEEIENYQKSLQNMTTEISLIEEKQRKEIAANIHDHLSQSLVISKMKLSDLQKNMKNSDSKKELIQVINHISNALDNSRKITYDLSPPVLYELGIIETLYWMVEKIEEEHKLKALFTTNIDYLNLSESKLIILYRIIQELINNIIKHAHAKKINIKLTEEKEGIQLILNDNGRGFDVNSLKEAREKNTGFGLFSVRERVNNLGGKLSIESEIGTGTKIKINLPLNIK